MACVGEAEGKEAQECQWNVSHRYTMVQCQCHTDKPWCNTDTVNIYMVQCLVINTDSDITHRLFRRLRDVLISKAFRKECRIKIAKGINCVYSMQICSSAMRSRA